MVLLPFKETPLNQHSLAALESWLGELGAKRIENDPCAWCLLMPNWSAQIKFEKEALSVVWEKEGQSKPCSFSYGLSREDIEMAILEGP